MDSGATRADGAEPNWRNPQRVDRRQPLHLRKKNTRLESILSPSTTLSLTWVQWLGPAKLERNEIEGKGKTQGAAVRLWRHARIPGFRVAGARILARRRQARCTGA